MGIWDSFKNILGTGESDEFEDDNTPEYDEADDKQDSQAEPVKKREPRIFQGGRGRQAQPENQQMQVVLFKTDTFDDVKDIADQFNQRKSVILNLESANTNVSRRILDFLSGAAYVKGGSIRKVASSTFMIAPRDVDVSGETTYDEYINYDTETLF